MTRRHYRWTATAIIAAGIAIAAGAVLYFGGASRLGFGLPQQTAAPAVARGALPPGTVKFAAGAPQLSSLKLTAVEMRPLPVSDPLNGRIAYNENRTARVMSPVSGRVVAMRAEIGDAVQSGSALAVIDSPDLASADADWRKAQADERMKKLAFDRVSLLFDGGVLARKDFETSQADYQQAQAETRRAGLKMKNLNAINSNGDGKFILKAPIAGVVADRQINPGLEVRPDATNALFVVSDLRQLWVLIDVPERNAGNLRPGQAVMIETDAHGERRFPARIDKVGLVLDANTRRIQVRCVIDNADLALKPEMFAKVAFLADANGKTGIALPNASFFTEGMYSYVFVETQPNVFQKRRVNIRLKGLDNSFVDTGLAAGERVVTEGAFLLSAEVSPDAQ